MIEHQFKIDNYTVTSLSDIQLIDDYYKNDSNSTFSKSGYDLTPYVLILSKSY